MFRQPGRSPSPAPPATRPRRSPGITPSLWRYARADHVADTYDDYFAFNALFDFDEETLLRHFDRPGRLIDLGCGTGRLLLPFARRGFRVLGIDLSLPMLDVTGEKARREHLSADRVMANLVELDCIRDGVADYCICMFSTLGMIHGRSNRGRVLAHARRILKPGGLFALHVHNRYFHVFDTGEWKWLFGGILSALRLRGGEPGDKTFTYREIPRMFLHLFTQRELKAALTAAGFRCVELIPLDVPRRRRLRHPWFFGPFRANGWIAVCR